MEFLLLHSPVGAGSLLQQKQTCIRAVWQNRQNDWHAGQNLRITDHRQS